MRWISLLRLDLHGWLSDQELPCRALGRKSVIESIPVGNCTAYLFLVSGRSLHTMQSRVGGLASFACFFFLYRAKIYSFHQCERTWGRSAIVR